MNTKKFGNIGEAVAISSFVKYGLPVYLPFGDNERSDLIAEFGGKLNKIQVKTSVNTKNGVVMFNLASSTCHRKKGCKHKYTPDEVDYFFCYNIARDKSYLIKVSDVPKTEISIRYELPKNCQNKNIHLEKECLFDNVIQKIIKTTAVKTAVLYCQIAQLVERQSVKLDVVGSFPTLAAICVNML